MGATVGGVVGSTTGGVVGATVGGVVGGTVGGFVGGVVGATVGGFVGCVWQEGAKLFDELVDDVSLDLAAALSVENLFGLFGLDPPHRAAG